MSASIFRDGDVVRIDDLGADGVVTRVLPGNWCDIRLSNGTEGADRFENLTLLRRPVRVGDRLCTDGSLPFVVAEQAAIHRYLPPLWTHADGTPIEPPHKTSGGGDHPDDLPGCRPKTEHHCIDRINHAPARGPEEAGFCSVLAHEALVTSLMHVDKQRTELLAENARLRRDIERKDREIAWLKRGGR